MAGTNKKGLRNYGHGRSNAYIGGFRCRRTRAPLTAPSQLTCERYRRGRGCQFGDRPAQRHVSRGRRNNSHAAATEGHRVFERCGRTSAHGVTATADAGDNVTAAPRARPSRLPAPCLAPPLAGHPTKSSAAPGHRGFDRRGFASDQRALDGATATADAGDDGDASTRRQGRRSSHSDAPRRALWIPRPRRTLGLTLRRRGLLSSRPRRRTTSALASRRRGTHGGTPRQRVRRCDLGEGPLCALVTPRFPRTPGPMLWRRRLLFEGPWRQTTFGAALSRQGAHRAATRRRG